MIMKHETSNSELFLPSNGTEGMSFIATWCANCRKDPASRNAESKTYCSILTRSLTECKQIKQWVYINGKPTCTSFVHYQQPAKTKKARPNKCQLTLF